MTHRQPLIVGVFSCFATILHFRDFQLIEHHRTNCFEMNASLTHFNNNNKYNNKYNKNIFRLVLKFVVPANPKLVARCPSGGYSGSICVAPQSYFPPLWLTARHFKVCLVEKKNGCCRSGQFCPVSELKKAHGRTLSLERFVVQVPCNRFRVPPFTRTTLLTRLPVWPVCLMSNKYCT